jgi:hypothetical protein
MHASDRANRDVKELGKLLHREEVLGFPSRTEELQYFLLVFVQVHWCSVGGTVQFGRHAADWRVEPAKGGGVIVMKEHMKLAVTKTKAHPDELILLSAADWNAARAELRLIWANRDKESLFGSMGELDVVDHDAIGSAYDRMHPAQRELAKLQPSTALGAKLLLDAVIDILHERANNPDATLGKGPTMEILTNVSRALAFGELPSG